MTNRYKLERKLENGKNSLWTIQGTVRSLTARSEGNGRAVPAGGRDYSSVLPLHLQQRGIRSFLPVLFYPCDVSLLHGPFPPPLKTKTLGRAHGPV